MTEQEIIELAREAGFFVSTELKNDPSHDRFHTFANALIKAHEAKLLKDAGEPLDKLDHPGPHRMMWTPTEMDYINRRVAAAIAKALAKADYAHIPADSKAVMIEQERDLIKQQKRIATLDSVLRVALDALDSGHGPYAVHAIKQIRAALAEVEGKV